MQNPLRIQKTYYTTLSPEQLAEVLYRKIREKEFLSFIPNYRGYVRNNKFKLVGARRWPVKLAGTLRPAPGGTEIEMEYSTTGHLAMNIVVLVMFLFFILMTGLVDIILGNFSINTYLIPFLMLMCGTNLITGITAFFRIQNERRLFEREAIVKETP